MPQLSLGTIEVLGLPAAVEAADVACKTADVKLIGYETTDGMGMVAVKIEGQVSAVQAAVAAASAAAARVSKVFATSIIARPSEQLKPVVFSKETVGLAKPKAAPAPKPEPKPEPVVEAAPEPEPAPVAAAESIPEPVEETLVEPVVEPTIELKPAAELPAPPQVRAAASQTRRQSTSKPRSTKK
jgi:ethanolamine utilization protein EutM